jgi:putative transposase
LEVTRPILVVIDGARGLRGAVTEVFDHPVIQRCQFHKLRNVSDRLPDAMASTVAKRMRRACHHTDPQVAQAESEALACELDRSHPGAAVSLREGRPRPSPSPGWACRPPWPEPWAAPTRSSR